MHLSLMKILKSFLSAPVKYNFALLLTLVMMLFDNVILMMMMVKFGVMVCTLKFPINCRNLTQSWGAVVVKYLTFKHISSNLKHSIQAVVGL